MIELKADPGLPLLAQITAQQLAWARRMGFQLAEWTGDGNEVVFRCLLTARVARPSRLVARETVSVNWTRGEGWSWGVGPHAPAHFRASPTSHAAWSAALAYVAKWQVTNGDHPRGVA